MTKIFVAISNYGQPILEETKMASSAKSKQKVMKLLISCMLLISIPTWHIATPHLCTFLSDYYGVHKTNEFMLKLQSSF